MSGYVEQQLGFVDPIALTVFTGTVLPLWEREKVKALVPDFPRIFEQAVIDFVKLKEGHKRGLFSPSQLSQAIEWFDQFT